MLRKNDVPACFTLTNDIDIVEHNGGAGDVAQLIHNQIKNTHKNGKNFIQEIQTGIFLVSIYKHDAIDTLQLKKASDKIQYTILPKLFDGDHFARLSINALKNHCLGLQMPYWLHAASPSHSPHAVDVSFYFHIDKIESSFASALKEQGLRIKEVLSNRCMIVNNHKFDYPVLITKLPSLTLWYSQNLAATIAQEIEAIQEKFQFCVQLLSSLKKQFKDCNWQLEKGKLRYHSDGVTRWFDYASLTDDIFFAGYRDRIDEYLSHFSVKELDLSTSFPTASVRSIIHLKARPESLSEVHNGYAIVAAKESVGKHEHVHGHSSKNSKTFSLWIKRVKRHLPRHNYRARVIFPSQSCSNTFSLVGEQIATIALFPDLIRRVFESLSLHAPHSVRLIAHNEDVLTIASDTASWVDINDVNQKASTVFRLVSTDGADPLTLFEQIILPNFGVGNFQLKIVPDTFFDLVDTAKDHRHSMPPGHDHYLLALAYECLHEWGLAVDQFQKALRLDAQDPDILHGLGCALMEVGQTKKALPFLKRAFALMPEDPEVANNCGRSNLELGLLSDAISAFERAVRLSPASADYLKNLGDGYLLAARTHDALEAFLKAIRCNPHFAEAHLSLAHLHKENGDEQLAKRHALLAYRENPLDHNIANLVWQLTQSKT